MRRRSSFPRPRYAGCRSTCNGFNVSGLAKGNMCFLRMKENSSSDSVQYEFPSSEQKSDEEGQLLVHGPDEIWRHEGEELILGTVSAFHGSNSVEYKWLIDGVPICSANACTHVVTKPGKYTCMVTLHYVIEDSQKVEKLTTESGWVIVVESSGSQNQLVKPILNFSSQLEVIH